MTSLTTRPNQVVRSLPAKQYAQAVMIAAILLGHSLLSMDAMAGVPEASGPVCVPVPGMPCPGTVSSSSSGTSRSSSYSTGSRSATPSTNSMILKELQSSIDRMTTPNPATLQKIRQTQMEGNQAHQEAVTSQQTAEEQRRQKALRDAEAARLQQIQDLANALQGLPGSSNPSVDLRPAGTPFFGQGGGANGAAFPGTNIDAIRAAGSSGFDTRGPLAGQLSQAAPPEPPPPTPVVIEEKPAPPEKMTPEIQALFSERETLRERKKEMQASLERFESKGQLTSEESAVMTKLQQDLATTLNKESYLTFSINESLP